MPRIAEDRTRDEPTVSRTKLLVAMCFALALVVGGTAALFSALPSIGADTGASQTQLNWITNGYAVAFASLLLTGGAIGDRYGRRGILAGGLAIFGAAFGAASLTSSAPALIAAGVVAGVGAAGVMPVTLSVLTTSFPEQERGRATGIWAGVASAAGISGLLLGGALLEVTTWPAIYASFAVLAALALLAALRVAPRSREEDAPPLDVPGILASVAGTSVLVYAIVEAPEAGWLAPRTLAVAGAGLVLLATFVVVELRHEEPMLDVRLFGLPGFAAGTASIALQFLAALGFFFLAAQFFQIVYGWSALGAAAALLPMGAGINAVAPRAPQIADRFGHRVVIPAGLVLMAGGLLTLAPLGPGSGYAWVIAGLIPFGLGFGLATAPATTLIVSSLPRARQGVASAVNDTARELGGALGLAVLGSALATRYGDRVTPALHGLPAGARAGIADSAAAAQQALPRLGPRADAVQQAVQQSFADGWWLALVIASGLLLVAAAFVAVRAPGRVDGAAGKAP